MIDGFRRAAFDRKHGQQLLQFIGIEPQAVSPGALVERQRRRSGMLHLDFVQRRIAARAQMRTDFGFDSVLPLETEQGIVRSRTGSVQERFQFARIQPQPATAMAEIDFNLLEVEDKKRDIAFWANALHISSRAGHDGAAPAEASSTSRVTEAAVMMLFIIATQTQRSRSVIYKWGVCL